MSLFVDMKSANVSVLRCNYLVLIKRGLRVKP